MNLFFANLFLGLIISFNQKGKELMEKESEYADWEDEKREFEQGETWQRNVLESTGSKTEFMMEDHVSLKSWHEQSNFMAWS